MVSLLKRRLTTIVNEVNTLIGEQLPAVPPQLPDRPQVELTSVESVLEALVDRDKEFTERLTQMTELENHGARLQEKGTKAEQESTERELIAHLALINWEDVLTEGRKARRATQARISLLRRRKGELVALIPPPVAQNQAPPPPNPPPQVANRMITLQPLQLRPFSGKVRDWQLFHGQFMASIDKLEIEPVDKFNYLLSFLEGEALTVVKGLMPTAANYKVALDLLKEKYDDPDSFSGELIEKFNALKPCRQFSDVRQFQIDLEAICRQLEALGENLNSNVICSSLENKLTFPFLKEMRKAKKQNRNWDTEAFRDKLAELVKEEEANQRAYYLQHSNRNDRNG